jgi:predicted P-loop ATPase
MDGTSRRLDDIVLRELWLGNAEFGHAPNKAFFEDVVENLGQRDQRHPVRACLDSLKWDGTPLIDTWLIDYFGAIDTPLTRVLGRKTLIAAVRRLRQPGVKFDQMLVLEGSQGAGKSRALRALAGDNWFTDNLEIGADTKRIVENTAGKWIVEVAELSGMNRRDVEHVKAMLSRQVDECRLAYDRKTTQAPRQFIMIGTTNASAYLLDDTGGRRFWPVKVADFIDCERLACDRDQLWAEAAAAEATGEPLFLPEELRPYAKEAQASRQISHPWRERLETLLDGQEGIIVKDDIYAALGIENGRLNKAFAGEIANHLTRLGWMATRLRHPEKKLGRVHVFRRGQRENWLQVVVETDPNRPYNPRAHIKTGGRASAGDHDPFTRRAAGEAT